MSIGTIINFCSNDYPYLRHCIEGVKPFSSQIIVPVCDHFFDGKKEDRKTLDQIYAEHPDVQFVEFPYDEKLSLYGMHSTVYWHNLARLIARYFLKEEIAFAFFLDCDEIVDSKRFQEWLSSFPYQEYDSIRFANYWYFRESSLQADKWEDSPLFLRKELLDGAMIFHERERTGMYDEVQGKKQRMTVGLDEKPLIHHYSWVRTKEQLIRKVRSWSHNWEKDWAKIVEEEFSHPFNGTDCVHGYAFTRVPPFAEINVEEKPTGNDTLLNHVRTLSHADVIKIDVALNFDIPICL